MPKQLSIIVAIDDDNGFAKSNEIPWYIRTDFAHFMKTTSDSVCVMGKNTYLEIREMKKKALKDQYNPADPVLRNRLSYVVSSSMYNSSEKFEDCRVVTGDISIILERLSLDPTLNKYDKVFILGGEQIFNDTIDLCHRVIMTHVPGTHDCTSFFPVDKLRSNFTPDCVVKSLGDYNGREVHVEYFYKK